MRIGWTVIMILALSQFIFASTVSGQAHEPVKIRLLAGPFGSGGYLIHSAVADIAKKHHPWLKLDHAESPGFIFNLKKLHEDPQLKKSLIIGAGGVVSWMASIGMKPFDKKYPPVKFLGNYSLVSVWLATLDPNIKSPKDLIGKKIAIGRTPQINWAQEPKWVIHHGWGIGDKVKIQYVGLKPAAAALLDGLVDAAVVGGYFDPIHKENFVVSPQTIELLASGRKIYYIPWGKEAVEKTIAAGMPIIPIMLPAKTVKYQKEPLPIFTDNCGWHVAPEFPEEIAYEFTKLVINNVSKFAEYASVGKIISKKALVFGWTPETIHPGALRAYKEAGILK